MELEIAVLSRAGGREVNQDACGFWSTEGKCFCVLSDGAGGHGGGDVASKLAVEKILSCFRENQECSADAIAAAMKYANDTIVLEQQTRADLSDMRATVVVLAIDFEQDVACWGHLGDSRLYCFRDQQIIARTRDHSVVQQMIDAGLLQPHEVRSSPERSKLLNALGDLDAFEPAVQRDPLRVIGNDKFLLCSDGLWEYIEDDEIGAASADAASAEEWLTILESRVLARGRRGQDNYSGLAIWCR